MNGSELSLALEPLLGAFSRLEIPYCIGGSIASSVHGVARSSLDADIVALVSRVDADRLCSALEGVFYVDADAAREAVDRRASFNVIHLSTMLKFDVFVLKDRPFDASAFSRRREETIPELAASPVYLTSAEDIVLYKLEWYRDGERISERQWNDVLGVLKVKRRELDIGYLRSWADDLRLRDLLEKALSEAGNI
jgi:hypothetical protein